MADVNFKINGNEVSAPAGSTILEAARLNGVDIPTLCYLKNMNKLGACRMCLVEVKGARIPQAACIATIREGMEVFTESDLVKETRKKNLELIADNHHMDCEYCPNYQDCELNALFSKSGVDTRLHGDFAKAPEYDETAVHLGRDASRCIQCRRCASACAAQGVNAIAVLGRGIKAKVGAPEGLGNSPCVGCGQCAAVCPTGSIFVKNDTHPVWVKINQGKKPVIAVVSPAVGVALGEKFHEGLGENVSGKLVAFLHHVGVKKVYAVTPADTDAQKREQAASLIQSGKTALSADCPSFVKYIENFYPELEENLVKVPSPEIVSAKLAREAYAAESGEAPEDITVMSISSCTAQKMERLRPEYEGVIDAAITTTELYEMLHYSCLSRYTTLDVWRKLQPEPYDELPGCEASTDPLPDAIKGDVNGTVEELETEIGGVPVKVKTVSGLGNARALLDAVKDGTSDCGYICVRACPGGCVAGGGQPKLTGRERNFEDPMEKRATAL